mmetsp:Transcript_122/g.448  ORF Transcript_122/g.448 Transcript_122/m.448 type:complete len:1109 (-) Transcript_122:145-3471(-)|eukprot:CAMPEP_0117441666 /NCGR_PEP_ID=MMETSP0759-20121206/3751_1 /TAXON_ID=63605 /ORGANISM="Percolomonas cosmopolitus, Strain WS" /LENGTH=1108 /DNA_ID=CAMNT_0005233525 /DNA_START=138 /DNA_END=3464 /DNA_ORIENTATION=+
MTAKTLSSSIAPSNVPHQQQKEEVNVQVVVRVRPPNPKEKNAPSCIQTSSSSKKELLVSQKLVSGKEITKTFSFDSVYGSRAGQGAIFKSTVQPIIEEVLEGYNCTIFAYGQTSSGKTYSMEGARDAKTNLIVPEKAGIIPRSIQYIFQKLEDNRAEYTLKVSVLELYNEELQDLLSQDELTTGINVPSQATFGSAPDKKRKKLRIFDDPKKGTIVSGLEEVTVRDADHVMHLLDAAATKRSIAETQMNALSSRSHVITTVTIHIREIKSDGEEIIKTGKLNLVDLAGSENIGRSGAVSKRAKEAGRINQSLLTLGRVITALTEGCPHIPYRESKLTRLLQDALGGRSKTCILATISPSSLNLEETLSTLDYAHTAKSIKNKPELNAKCSKLFLMKEMSGDLEKLKQELRAQREKNGVYMPVEQHDKMLADQEKANRRIDELKTEIDTLTSERDDVRETLESETLAHKLTQKTLHETTTVLRNTTEDLRNTIKRLQQSEYMLQATRRTELSLSAQAEDLRLQLRQSIEEVDGLRRRLTRHECMEFKNSEAVHTFHKRAEDGYFKVQSDSSSFTNQQREIIDTFKEQAHSQWKNSYESISLSLKQKAKDAQRCHQRQIESINQLVNAFSHDNLTQLDAQSEHLKSEFAALRSATEEAHNSIHQELTREVESIERQLNENMNPLINNFFGNMEKLVGAFVQEQGTHIASLENNLNEQLTKYAALSQANSEKLSQMQASQQQMRQQIKQSMMEKLNQLLSDQEQNFEGEANTLQSQLSEQSKALSSLRESSSNVLCEAQSRTESLQETLNERAEQTTNSFSDHEHATQLVIESTKAQIREEGALWRKHHECTEQHIEQHMTSTAELSDAQRRQWAQFNEDISEKNLDFATQMQIIKEDQDSQFQSMQEQFFETQILGAVDSQHREMCENIQVYCDEQQSNMDNLNEISTQLLSTYKDSYESTGETPQKLTHRIPETFAQTATQKVLLSKFEQEQNGQLCAALEKENLVGCTSLDDTDIREEDSKIEESSMVDDDASSTGEAILKQRDDNVPILQSPPRIKHGKGRKRGVSKSTVGQRRKRQEMMSSKLMSPGRAAPAAKRRKVRDEADLPR